MTAASFGSQQLRLFRQARRNGHELEIAAELAGMSIGEAKIHDERDAKNPPPDEAYELLVPQPKEPEMGRTARKPPEDDGEVKTKDFAGAVRLYREDIRPAQSKVGEHAQEQSTAYKAIKKNCHIQPAAAKLAFKLAETEEAKREDFLRCLKGLLDELGISIESADLVDVAEGKAQTPKPRSGKPKLVTVPPAPADDSDLADPSGKEPAAGTSAAAIAAMREDHAKDKAEEDFDGPPPRNAPAED